MESATCAGHVPTAIHSPGTVQNLQEPPKVHIAGIGATQDHYAALSRNEAQNIKLTSVRYEKETSQIYQSSKKTETKCNYSFLCFRKGGKDCTVKVFFAWPGRTVVRVEKVYLPQEEGKTSPPKTSEKHPSESLAGLLVGVEAVDAQASLPEVVKQKIKWRLEHISSTTNQGSRTEVMHALQDALYKQQGQWKRWLWGYGIQHAYEISFHFDNVAEKAVAPICVTALDQNAIRDAAQATLDNKPTGSDYEYGDTCWGPPYHTQECLAANEVSGVPCIQDRISEAESRLHGFRMQHWLKECLRCPDRAQMRPFLEQGLLQKSFVYLAEDLTTIQSISMPQTADELATAGEVRGIHVTLGWDLSRMLRHARAGGVWTVFGVAVVWLGSLIWAGQTRDWGTAWAFGQVLAASVALLVYHT
ncbi:hypothetical protein LTR56_006723 [Elasticomyces elasticus]|nr:hypothetical protein LTR22_017734 [Elasticomyces elasticus]KAK3649824.1 hypothetical protein LTR56_006723 [Elasticomyces elasticus]KAK4913092.1 hypothetical protein LTR49_018558 [Elasticomyces elasticus]KAK5762516.1 hypothetical protein LTS12_007307 [Elasticomyces elasticus]